MKIAVLENYKYKDLRSSWTKQMIWLAEALKKQGFEVVTKNLICNGLSAGKYDHEKHNPADIVVYNHCDISDLTGHIIQSRQNWFFKPTVPDGIHTTIDTIGFGPFSEISFNKPDFESMDMADVRRFFSTKVKKWIDEKTLKWKVDFKQANIPYEDYWLVLGQVAGDTTTTRHDFGDYNKKLYQVVRELARIDDRDIVVKLHPYTDGTTARHTKFSDKLDRELSELSPKVHVYKGKIEIHEFIRKCRAVVLANSGSGIETMMHHKPIIAWGRPEYRWVAYDLQYLADMIRAVDIGWFDVEKQDKWLYWYLAKYCYHDQKSCDARVAEMLRDFPFDVDLQTPRGLGMDLEGETSEEDIEPAEEEPQETPEPVAENPPEIKLSIITAAWDGYGRHFPDFMKRIEKQTVKPHEVILVMGRNHGVETTWGDVKIVKQEELLPWGAMINKGVEVATGDYVLFFDIDDRLLHNAVEEIIATAKTADVISPKYRNWNDKVKGLPVITYDGKEFSDGGSQTGYLAWKKEKLDETPVWKWALLYKAYAEDRTVKETEKVIAKYTGRNRGIRSIHGKPYIVQEIEKYRQKYSKLKSGVEPTTTPKRGFNAKNIHVVQTFDNNYAPFSHNSMLSLIETTPNVIIHAIITKDVEDKYLLDHKQVIYYRNTPKRKFEGFRAAESYIKGCSAPYNYIEALDILDVPRFIIQGIDMIATTSLKPLYETRVSDLGVAAIPQSECLSRSKNQYLAPVVPAYSSGMPVKQRWKRVVTFPLASVVVDIKTCRRSGLYKKIKELYESVYALGDMLIYQIAVEGKYYPLDGRWCVGANNNPMNKRAGNLWIKSKRDLWIINWYGGMKPWHDGAPLKEYWDRYNKIEPVRMIEAAEPKSEIVAHF